jgi:hypothetical protein
MCAKPVVSFSSQLTSRWNQWYMPPKKADGTFVRVANKFDVTHGNDSPSFKAPTVYRTGSLVLLAVAVVETVVLVPFAAISFIFSGLKNTPHQYLTAWLRSSKLVVQWNRFNLTSPFSYFTSHEVFSRYALNKPSLSVDDYVTLYSTEKSCQPGEVRGVVAKMEFALKGIREVQEQSNEIRKSARTYDQFLKVLFSNYIPLETSRLLSEEALIRRHILYFYDRKISPEKMPAQLYLDSGESFPVTEQHRAALKALLDGTKSKEQYLSELASLEKSNLILQACWEVLPGLLAQDLIEQAAACLADVILPSNRRGPVVEAQKLVSLFKAKDPVMLSLALTEFLRDYKADRFISLLNPAALRVKPVLELVSCDLESQKKLTQMQYEPGFSTEETQAIETLRCSLFSENPYSQRTWSLPAHFTAADKADITNSRKILSQHLGIYSAENNLSHKYIYGPLTAQAMNSPLLTTCFARACELLDKQLQEKQRAAQNSDSKDSKN